MKDILNSKHSTSNTDLIANHASYLSKEMYAIIGSFEELIVSLTFDNMEETATIEQLEETNQMMYNQFLELYTLSFNSINKHLDGHSVVKSMNDLNSIYALFDEIHAYYMTLKSDYSKFLNPQYSSLIEKSGYNIRESICDFHDDYKRIKETKIKR